MTERPSSRDSGGDARWLVLLTLAGLAVRVAFLLLEPSNRLAGDETRWVNWGIAEPGGVTAQKVRFSLFRNHMIFDPPLYPYFIGALYELFGALTAVKWAQVFVGSLLIPAVARVGALAFGPRVGLLAAGIAAFYPELVWYPVHFWSETLFMTSAWWAIERLLVADGSADRVVARSPLRGREWVRELVLALIPIAALWLVWGHGREPVARAAYACATAAGWWAIRSLLASSVPGRRTAVVAGFLWGIAILTRETPLYFTPVAALWLLAREREGPARAGLFALMAFLTVAPWTYRNYVVFRAVVPVSTAGGLNLWQGNAGVSREEIYRQYEAVQGRIEQYRHAQRKGIEAILERQPTWLIEKLRHEMPAFWEVDSLVLIHLKMKKAYGPCDPGTAVAVALVVLIPYVVVLALFAPGLTTLVPSRASVLLVGFLAYYNLVHVATHGFSRYRLPVMPVVFLLAASAWEAWRSGGLRVATPARRVIGGLVAVALLASVVPSLRRHAADPAFRHPDESEEISDEPPSP